MIFATVSVIPRTPAVGLEVTVDSTLVACWAEEEPVVDPGRAPP